MKILEVSITFYILHPITCYNLYILACNPCKHMNASKIKHKFYYKDINY